MRIGCEEVPAGAGCEAEGDAAMRIRSNNLGARPRTGFQSGAGIYLNVARGYGACEVLESRSFPVAAALAHTSSRRSDATERLNYAAAQSFVILWAMQTRLHSSLTLSSPRRRN